MGDMVDPEIASISASGTNSTNILHLFYDGRTVITVSPDKPTVSMLVSGISLCTDKTTSVPFGYISLLNKPPGDCSSSLKIGHSYCSLSCLKWELKD